MAFSTLAPQPGYLALRLNPEAPPFKPRPHFKFFGLPYELRKLVYSFVRLPDAVKAPYDLENRKFKLLRWTHSLLLVNHEVHKELWIEFFERVQCSIHLRSNNNLEALHLFKIDASGTTAVSRFRRLKFIFQGDVSWTGDMWEYAVRERFLRKVVQHTATTAREIQLQFRQIALPPKPSHLSRIGLEGFCRNMEFLTRPLLNYKSVRTCSIVWGGYALDFSCTSPCISFPDPVFLVLSRVREGILNPKASEDPETRVCMKLWRKLQELQGTIFLSLAAKDSRWVLPLRYEQWLHSVEDALLLQCLGNESEKAVLEFQHMIVLLKHINAGLRIPITRSPTRVSEESMHILELEAQLRNLAQHHGITLQPEKVYNHILRRLTKPL